MKRGFFLAGVAALLAAVTTAVAFGDGGPITPYASNNQVIQSGPGVYAQTTAEYAGSWVWSQQSAPFNYYWYLFHSSGTLVASRHMTAGGGDSWTGTPNIYYLKEYNNEPSGSGHINILSVDYCC
jgi:hypothetical protein